jgi:signal transduction histidine kinase/CheY-like chemotaxis protein
VVGFRSTRSAFGSDRHLGLVHWWWLGLSVRAKGLTVIVIPLVALVIAISASLVLQGQEDRERGAVQGALRLSNAASVVLQDALNGETGVRGYGATGDPVFLQPYTFALARIGPDRMRLAAAAAAEGIPGQAQAAVANAAARFASLARIRSDIGHGIPIRTLTPALLRGKKSMDVLRLQIARIIAVAGRVQAGRGRAVSSLEAKVDLLNAVGLGLGILAGLGGAILFSSGISRRVRAAVGNAERLGAGEPLESVEPAGDDLGRLADALVDAQRLLTQRAEGMAQARDAAVRANQAKNSFLSHTSHELRTPLNAILGFAQLLALSDLDEADSDSTGRILQAGHHLLALINELIDIARIESGELSVSIEPVPVLPVVDEAARLMGQLAADRSIEIIQHSAHPGLAVQADRHRFLQILVNLLSNAVKYNRRGGSITITCRAEPAGQVSTVVADTGPGIALDDIERVFIPFERLGAEQTAIEGTGIGLPLAKALAEAMGGCLSASTILGEGSAFTVSLPRAADMAHVPVVDTEPGRADGAPVAGQPLVAAGDTIRILYIEDNPANVEVITRFLATRPNTSLRSVTEGRAGLESAVVDLPDVILLDLHLPGLQGDQVLTELKAEPRTAAIPVVVLSAEAAPAVIRRLRTLGACHYLTKPVDLAELGGLLDSFTGPVMGYGPTDRAAPI